MTNRKIRDYQRNRKLKGIVDANFKTFATVAIALKQLFPHDWYKKNHNRLYIIICRVYKTYERL